MPSRPTNDSLPPIPFVGQPSFLLIRLLLRRRPSPHIFPSWLSPSQKGQVTRGLLAMCLLVPFRPSSMQITGGSVAM